MPVFELQTPDGRSFEMDAPDINQAVQALGSIPNVQPQQKRDEKSFPFMNRIDAAMRGAADAITFGMADRIAAGLESLTGIGGKAGDYSGNLAKERAIDVADEENNQAARVAGQLAGGFVLPGGVAKGGATLGARIGRGISAGAAQGAAYGAGSSPDLTNTPEVIRNAASGGLVGGAIGGVAAPIAEGVTAAGEFVGNRTGILPAIRGAINPGQEASRRVGEFLTRDSGRGLSPQEFQSAQNLGQPVVIADLGGENTRSIARSAANISPESRQIMTDKINARFESQAQRIADFVLDLGGGGKAFDISQNIEGLSRKFNKPLYQKAYAEGAKGIWNDDLANLMQAPAMQDAVRGAIKTGANRDVAEGYKPTLKPFKVDADGNITPVTKPNGDTVIPSLQFWDHVKRNLDDTFARLSRSGEKSAAADAKALKNKLVENVTNAVPSYAKARGVAAAFFGAENAVEAGAKFATRKGPGVNDATRQVLSKMQPHERELFGVGFASALSDKINSIPDRRSVLNTIFNSPSSKEQVRMALGSEKASRLETYLHTEATMDMLRGAVQGNSTTARQLAEMGLAAGVGGYEGGWSGALTGAAFAKLARMGGQKIDQNVVRKIGEMLVSSDPATYNKAMRAIQNSGALKRFVKSITPAMAAAAIPVVIDRLNRRQNPDNPANTYPTDEFAGERPPLTIRR